MEQKELPWIEEARKYIGLKEIVGPKNNPTIVDWVTSLFKATNQKAFYADDDNAWCGSFTSHCLSVTGRKYPKMFMRAGDFRTIGLQLTKPAYGALGIKARKGGNHVFFIIGKTKDNRIVGLGGNQSNSVSITTFHPDDIDTIIWPGIPDKPDTIPYPERYDLPIYSNDLKSSSSEA